MYPKELKEVKWSDSSPDGDGKGMFIVGEIGEPELPNGVSTKPIYLLFTLIGIGLLAIGLVLYLYSAAIMSFYGLRLLYWNWGFSSLALAFFAFFLSKYFRNKIGYTRIDNLYNKYKVKPLLGNSFEIDKTKVFALTIQHYTRYFGLLKNQPYVVISTYDKTYEIPLYRYNNHDKLIEYFSDISNLLQDDYYTIFQKSEINFPSLFQRVWRQSTGKLAILILIIYTYFAAWGAFSMMLYPENVLYARSFFLNNPEISFSFLPGYDTRSIIYQPPSRQFWLGTDWFGRDIFARMVYGTATAVGVAFVSASIYIVLVFVLGITTALFEGWWKEIIIMIENLLLTFPPILMIIIVATFVGAADLPFDEAYYYYIFIIMALLTWPQGSKFLRIETRKLLDQEFMIAARRAGSSEWRLIRKHVIPKNRASIVLLFIYTITEVIFGMTMIGIISLGNASLTWGGDIHRAIIFDDIPLKERWWVLIYPCIWVAGLIIGLTLLSDSIRDQFQLTVNQLKKGGDKLE